jgi:hypothetical protein
VLLGVFEVFGELEKFVSELYPYRYVITPLLIFAAVAAAYGAYRARLYRPVVEHRLLSTAIGVPLLIGALFAGDYLLSPLWERSRLDEASPLASVPTRTEPMNDGDLMPVTEPMDDGDMMPVAMEEVAAPTPIQPGITASGMFKGADDFHFGRGDAQLIRTANGSYVLRFENFSVRNGPDLYVYLSTDPSGKRVEEGLNLGRLKATDGAFNYEVPAEIDLAHVKSVVVWCRQFSVQFAVAALM